MRWNISICFLRWLDSRNYILLYRRKQRKTKKANTPFHKMCEDKTTIVSGYMETFLNINFTAWPTCLFTMSRKKNHYFTFNNKGFN